MAEESSVNCNEEAHRRNEETQHSLSSNLADVEVNTNQRLCSVLLNEFNYLPWSRAVSLALGGRGKLGFVNGSVEAPNSSSSEYSAWLCKDQLVMSLLLNTMEKHVAEIFSYYNSSLDLWKALQDMYGNQNNYARVFQLKKDIAIAQQEGKTFVQHLGSLKAMWNELDVYLPHTIDPTILLKRAEEDRIYQLLGSLNSEYEDLRSHILMSQELPTFNNVCATIQREEARKKVMNAEHSSRLNETRAYASNYKNSEAKGYKGRNTHLKCKYCNGVGHVEDKCWELHPELKPKFTKDGKIIPRSSQQFHSHPKAQLANAQGSMEFTANPLSLINEFAAYLQSKGHGGGSQTQGKDEGSHTSMLGQFAGFLAGNEKVSHEDAPGILKAFTTALITSTENDCWIIDSGATDHMTNKVINLHHFKRFPSPSHVSVANGKNVLVLGKGKINLLSHKTPSTALYVPTFPFQLLSIGKLTNTLNCRAIFSPEKVIFQDVLTMKMIGEWVFINGLYYLCKDACFPKVFQAQSKSIDENQLWHKRLAHPSDVVLSKLFPFPCKSPLTCDTCQYSKFTRLPFGNSMSRTREPFEMVHTDVWGPATESMEGFKYFVLFVDDFTRMSFLYLMKSKNEVSNIFKEFHMHVKTQFQSNIKVLRSDNGT